MTSTHDTSTAICSICGDRFTANRPTIHADRYGHMPKVTPDPARLAYTYPNGEREADRVEAIRVLRVRTFQVLADLAFPLVEHYRSDLLHDVHWLDKYLEGPQTFYYGADGWGTAIGTDAPSVHISRDHVWRIDIAANVREWSTDWSVTATVAR
jgi:hypothetical protein